MSTRADLDLAIASAVIIARQTEAPGVRWQLIDLLRAARACLDELMTREQLAQHAAWADLASVVADVRAGGEPTLDAARTLYCYALAETVRNCDDLT